MSDLIKKLDGNVDEVKARLHGVSHDDLLKLQQAEKAGKDRQGVTDALAAALKAADTQRAGGTVAGVAAIAADLDPSAPADIAPADTVDTSGAPQQIVPDVDLSHPAVDADPRANTTEVQNRIDFNDPTKSGADAVDDMLRGSRED